MPVSNRSLLSNFTPICTASGKAGVRDVTVHAEGNGAHRSCSEPSEKLRAFKTKTSLRDVTAAPASREA